MLRLYARNSFGAKWDALWTNWLGPALAANNDDVAAVIMKTGWAPWVPVGDVHMKVTYYSFDGNATWFSSDAPRKSPFCAGIAAARRKKYALWVPWVKNLERGTAPYNVRDAERGGIIQKQKRADLERHREHKV